MKKKKIAALLFLPLVAILLSGCTFIRIQNVSDSPVRVAVIVPDSGGGYTRSIPSGGLVDVFSSHGGRYTVTIVPNEQYRETLLRLQEQISDRLFNERASLTGAEVAQLVENLNHITALLQELELPGASCSGNVPDFETAVVVIAYDSFNNSWELSCG
jgi:hypothetical protein